MRRGALQQRHCRRPTPRTHCLRCALGPLLCSPNLRRCVRAPSCRLLRAMSGRGRELRLREGSRFRGGLTSSHDASSAPVSTSTREQIYCIPSLEQQPAGLWCHYRATRAAGGGRAGCCGEGGRGGGGGGRRRQRGRPVVRGPAAGVVPGIRARRRRPGSQHSAADGFGAAGRQVGSRRWARSPPQACMSPTSLRAQRRPGLLQQASRQASMPI